MGIQNDPWLTQCLKLLAVRLPPVNEDSESAFSKHNQYRQNTRKKVFKCSFIQWKNNVIIILISTLGKKFEDWYFNKYYKNKKQIDSVI